MEPTKKFCREKNKIKINVVGLLIYSFDREFSKPNIDGCRICGLWRCLAISKKENYNTVLSVIWWISEHDLLSAFA